MGILDSLLGGLLGGNTAAGPIQSILSSVLSGQAGAGNQNAGGQSAGGQSAGQPGLMGLLQQFTQAGHGDVANSWVGNGPNQPIQPSALQQVFGQNQVNQWSQQTGMAPNDILSQLAQFLPHAVDKMTPTGQVPAGGGSPFDEAGVELPRR